MLAILTHTILASSGSGSSSRSGLGLVAWARGVQEPEVWAAADQSKRPEVLPLLLVVEGAGQAQVLRDQVRGVG
jgi:hypothetical protein